MEKYISMFKSKKAQVWSFDLVIAGMIFLIGVVILLIYMINYNNQAETKLDKMFNEGYVISDLVLSEDNGILSDNKINQTKLEEFYDSVQADYSLKKRELGSNYDFYFTIPGLEINGNNLDHIGKKNQTSVEDNIKITRITIYKNKPVKFELYIWR
jgi:hypothetical protein